MNAEIAGHAGTPQLKQFHMVNIKTEFPRGINSDQVISANKRDGGMKVRAPGPGLKLRHGGLTPEASGAKRQASSTKLVEHQATSVKPQAASVKRQAASDKLHDS